MPDNPRLSDRLRNWWENDGTDLVAELVMNLVMLSVVFMVMGALDWLGALD